jgi:hypothetical protein
VFQVVRGENKVHGTPFVWLQWLHKGQRKALRKVSRQVLWQRFDKDYKDEPLESVHWTE